MTSELYAICPARPN